MSNVFSFKELIDENLETSFFFGKIFVAKYRNKYLIGPHIKHIKDLNVFKRRILSSSFNDIDRYLKTNSEIVELFLQDKNDSYFLKKIVEIDDKQNVHIYNIADIPFYE